jgi:hypothetical protein
VGRPDTVVADVPYGSQHRHAGISFRGLWRRNGDEDEHPHEHVAEEHAAEAPEGAEGAEDDIPEPEDDPSK